jgi:hypothetical protein
MELLNTPLYILRNDTLTLFVKCIIIDDDIRSVCSQCEERIDQQDLVECTSIVLEHLLILFLGI